MKKLILAMILVIAISLPAFAETQEAIVAEFDVTLNGENIDNSTLAYPLLVYNNITYVPMDYKMAKKLGLTTSWNQAEGLSISLTDAEDVILDQTGANIIGAAVPVQLATGNISVSNRAINNQTETYPLLSYKNITYFPLTWQFAVDEFQWDFSWDNTTGLAIDLTKEPAKVVEDNDETIEAQVKAAFEPVLPKKYKVHYANVGVDKYGKKMVFDASSEFDPFVLVVHSDLPVTYDVFDPKEKLLGVITSGSEDVNISKFDGPVVAVEGLNGGDVYPLDITVTDDRKAAFDQLNPVLDKIESFFNHPVSSLTYVNGITTLRIDQITLNDIEKARYAASESKVEQISNDKDLAYWGVEELYQSNVSIKQKVKINDVVPTSLYKAHYIDINTWKVIGTDRLDDLVDSRSNRNSFNSTSNIEAVYYSRNLYFDKSTTQYINVDIGQAYAKIYIDGEEIKTVKTEGVFEHYFSAGNHIIEVEIIGSRYATNWAVLLYDKVDIDVINDENGYDTLKPYLNSKTFVNYAYVDGYMGSSNETEVYVNYTSDDTVLFLNSKMPTAWKLTGHYQNVKAIVVGYEKEGSTVENAGDIPVYYYKDLPKPSNFFWDKYAGTSLRKMIDPEFYDLNRTIVNLTGKRLSSFSSANNASKVSTHDIYLSTYDYESYEAKDAELKMQLGNKQTITNLLESKGQGIYETWKAYLPYGAIPNEKFTTYYFSTTEGFDAQLITETRNIHIGLQNTFKNANVSDLAIYCIGTFDFAGNEKILFNKENPDARIRFTVDGKEITESKFRTLRGEHTIEIEILVDGNQLEFDFELPNE